MPDHALAQVLLHSAIQEMVIAGGRGGRRISEKERRPRVGQACYSDEECFAVEV